MGGVGVRFGYYVHPNIALDAEFLHDSGFGDGPHGETTGLVGIRAGQRFWNRFGLFAKVRPGIVHCGGSGCLARFKGHPDFFLTDLGGVLEYYPSRRGFLRLDISDVLIPYGSATSTGYPGPALGLRHHQTTELSFGWRF